MKTWKDPSRYHEIDRFLAKQAVAANIRATYTQD